MGKDAPMKRTIEIDLEVNKIIEANRQSFEETENSILRRLLRIDPAAPSLIPKVRPPRSSGAYSTVVGKRPIEANSLKELLRRTILVLEAAAPGFIKRLSERTTPKGRKIVAREPAQLYPRSPQLTEYAEKLADGWWYDTNVGRRQVAAYMRLFAEMAGLSSIPSVNKRSEKTTLTLEDLELNIDLD